jgi:hypothetical protein
VPDSLALQVKFQSDSGESALKHRKERSARADSLAPSTRSGTADLADQGCIRTIAFLLIYLLPLDSHIALCVRSAHCSLASLCAWAEFAVKDSMPGVCR